MERGWVDPCLMFEALRMYPSPLLSTLYDHRHTHNAYHFLWTCHPDSVRLTSEPGKHFQRLSDTCVLFVCGLHVSVPNT